MHKKEKKQISKAIEREMAQVFNKKNSILWGSGQASLAKNFNIRGTGKKEEPNWYLGQVYFSAGQVTLHA